MNVRRYLLAFLLILLTFSCKEKEQPHLSREKMARVLEDLHMAEVYSTMVNDSAHTITNKNLDSLAVYYRTILKHHGISMEQLRTSIDWYETHSKDLDTIYTDIQNRMSTLEGVINAGGTTK